MKSFNLLSAVLFFSCLTVKSEQNVNEAISKYVRNLILDLALRDSEIHDIAVHRFSKFKQAKRFVEETFEDICRAIPKNVVVNLSPTNVTIESRGLRLASLTILITDASDIVSAQCSVYCHLIEVFSWYRMHW